MKPVTEETFNDVLKQLERVLTSQNERITDLEKKFAQRKSNTTRGQK